MLHMESHPLPRQGEDRWLVAIPIAQATDSSCSYLSKIAAHALRARTLSTTQPPLLGGEAGYALDRLQSRVTAVDCAVQGFSIDIQPPRSFDRRNYREALITLCS
ncbi:hypothetical protein V8C34DRAFT_316744 [Trichoderma compactum]